MTLAGGGQPARRLHDVWSDIRRFMNERRAILETTRGCGLHDSLITKEIVRQAYPCVSNHVPDTNFPLKHLDGPSQGVREDAAGCSDMSQHLSGASDLFGGMADMNAGKS
jgi:hypothetical protein